MASIILIVLLILSFYLIKKYGFCGLAGFFLLCGSITDSAGILYAIDSHFAYFKLLIWIFSFSILFISSIIIISKKYHGEFFKWYFIPFISAFLLMLVSALVKGETYAYISSSLIMTGIPYFFMWFIGRSKPGRENVLFGIILIHSIVSMIVIIGKGALAEINGLTYVYRIDENFQNYDINALINNSISLFDFNKYLVQKTAQFHNSNALGFFSSVVIVLGVALKFKMPGVSNLKSKNLLGLLFLVLGIVFWFNSLTRGPIVMLICILVFIYSRSWKIKANFLVYFVMAIVLLVPAYYFLPVILEYLFPTFDNVSYTGRVIGYQMAYDSILKNPLFGGSANEYPAHIYTLKIMAYHGVPAGILITIPILHILYKNLKYFLKDVKNRAVGNSTFSLMLVATLYGVFFTNGTVSYVLFGIVLAEACIRNKIRLTK